MRTLLAALMLMSLTGCAALPAWWGANATTVIAVGAIAGAASQVESAAINTRTLVKDVEADTK